MNSGKNEYKKKIENRQVHMHTNCWYLVQLTAREKVGKAELYVGSRIGTTCLTMTRPNDTSFFRSGSLW